MCVMRETGPFEIGQRRERTETREDRDEIGQTRERTETDYKT